ncbi:MAG: prolyl oligopeptidase family serine peptidase [Planctomycetes bacterium]|nr:prolyl oligopeptidase family serine peptidase [Planctomycetota bacterium]
MRHGWIAAATLLLALPGWAQDAATLSFAQNHEGSYPRALGGEQTIHADLSALPAGVEVYRAVLRPGRIDSAAMSYRDVPLRVTLEGQEEPLKLLPPRFSAFDVTAEVRAALAAGRRTISFVLASLPGQQSPFNRLDVTCAARAKREIPLVTGLTAIHRAGQTILTWNEPILKGAPEKLKVREWLQMRESHVTNSRRHRYRIYRSREPISAATIGKAELVDEVEPLTGWDGEYYGIDPKKDALVPRYVVLDGADPVPPGTAVYAHNPKAGGPAYYAVSLALDGEEDLSTFDRRNSIVEAIEESVGPGVPVLQRVEHPEEFNYVKKPTLHYYVRWESPPNANLPSRPIDYLVAFPPKKVDPAPVGLHLHCWGGNLDGGYGWWYDAHQGAILISTNQIPYDWWTGYHEHAGTWKPWREGVVRDYTQTRLISFLDWAATQWKLDPTRVFTAGNSMGGSGSPSVALRRADRVAWCVSWVGVHRPAESPQFASSYERVYGLTEWRLNYQDRKTRAFEYFDDAAFVRQDPARETPLIVFANGKNDKAIGWEQAREFWKALQETRRPHVFRWGQSGHGQRALLPGPAPGEREIGIDVRLDRTLPAFSNCSLDDDPGDGSPEIGAREGQSNLHLLWETDSSADEAGRWSMVLRLGKQAPKDDCRVDVTPRRCFQFRAREGTKVKWKNQAAGGAELQSGEVMADRWGLVTVPGVRVDKEGSRLSLEIPR